MEELRLCGIHKESIVDGPGLRFTIFAQGCLHNCRGCHNPQSHPIEGGYRESADNLLKQILQNPLLQGVTFSGGDPFEQAEAFAFLGKKIHEHPLDLWCYTGYTMEELVRIGNPKHLALLEEVDVLVDGPFDQEKKTLQIPFLGSTNQRIIHVKRTLRQGRVVSFQESEEQGKTGERI